MKHCPQCQLEFPDHFRFCGACGGALTTFVRCPDCGELTGTEWPFCTNCGQELSATTRASHDEETVTKASAPGIQRRVVPDPRALDTQAMETLPASEARRAPTLTILSAYGEPETPPPFRWWHGAIFAFVLLLFVGVLGIGAWYLWSPSRSVTQASQSGNLNAVTSAQNVSSAASYQPTSTITPQHATVDHSADEEITRLRERRIVANSSESAEIISALEQGEKQYPTDYRFPYELSKLSIKGIVTHHEAFESLARAAEKAIDSGKAEEMLNSLMSDKDEDFYKLSHGHHEWEMFEQALRSKDKKVLKMDSH